MKSLGAMIRYLILAFAFAAVPVAQAGMQGNLPAPSPAQKLPPYSPVVCVAPNWATEPLRKQAPSGAARGKKPSENQNRALQ
jgi:hypothetical protein